ncbi:MAG: SDR family NAD(P)-dependent oxidoreductase, partial [Acidimicrobiia bacterium]
LPEGEWDRIWDSNVKAAYLATQLVVPGMREAGWGRIVNISAGSAYLRNHSVYTLAKEAMITLTEELALELGPEITVNCIAPGQIAESAADIAEFDPTFVERSIEYTPAGRLVTRAEVAAIVVELCSPRFAMVTGATIPVDGGWRFNRF